MSQPPRDANLGRLFGSAQQLAARGLALGRYERWESEHPSRLEPGDAIAGIGFLYELLPVAGRERAVDTTGVAVMHRCLTALSGRTP